MRRIAPLAGRSLRLYDLRAWAVLNVRALGEVVCVRPGDRASMRLFRACACNVGVIGSVLRGMDRPVFRLERF